MTGATIWQPVSPPGRIIIALPATRPAIEALTEWLIDRLDAIDGDPDFELNGDDADGTSAEDEICNFPSHLGVGCEISDPDHCVTDERHDPEHDFCPDYGIDHDAGPLGMLSAWHPEYHA